MDEDHELQRLRAAPTRSKLRALLEMYARRKDYDSGLRLAEGHAYLLDADMVSLFPVSEETLLRASALQKHEDTGMLDALLEVNPGAVLRIFDQPCADVRLMRSLNFSGVPTESFTGNTLAREYARYLRGLPVDETVAEMLSKVFLEEFSTLDLGNEESAFNYEKVHLKRLFHVCLALKEIAPSPELESAANSLMLVLHEKTPLELVESITTQEPQLALLETLLCLDRVSNAALKDGILVRLEEAEIGGDFIAQWIVSQRSFAQVARQQFSPHCQRLAAHREVERLVDEGNWGLAIELLTMHQHVLGPWAARQKRIIEAAVGTV